MRLWGLLFLACATGLAAEPSDLPLEATLVATTPREFILVSEKRIPVSLVLTNTGRRPLAIVRSVFGSGLSVHYTPEADDHSRKAGSWSRNVVPLIPESGEPSMSAPSEYVLVAPGKDYRTEVDIAPLLRELGPYGLAPGDYVIDFSYAYEPNRAETSVPLIPAVRATAPVRLSVSHWNLRDRAGLVSSLPVP